MPDREVAARLAALRRESVDLERRLRGDTLEAPDSEAYWRGQLDRWRGGVEARLETYPFQLRAFQAPLLPPGDDADWAQLALAEIAERRSRLDAIIERVTRED